ncbi:MAG: GTPase/DUF3482 domain-containing protein [Desulfobacterales bacterium]
MKNKIPVFAVLGHPNEGKSSVVATLAEDDSVPISPTPGETRFCREYPVIIDGAEIIRFVDTPGFQNPRAAHKWIQDAARHDSEWISAFISSHKNSSELTDECELFSPLADGAGIIFVVDGSRPVRNTDRVEMDILRLTGLARMAVINTKDRQHGQYIEDWKNTARKHFNTIRIFDSHKASFSERMALLESLKAIDPDWQDAIETVIKTFSDDWENRIQESTAIITELIEKAIAHTAEKTIRNPADKDPALSELTKTYQKQIAEMEHHAHQRIKKLFKHNIFSWDLPPQSMVNQDLFSRKTWQALGLTRSQMTWAGAGIGAGIGAKADLAAGGLAFGVFTALGGAIGAGSAAWGTRRIAGTRIKGMPLGGIRLRVGPVKNDQLIYVMIDRCLIYFSHIINWAHSRRDKPGKEHAENPAIPEFLTAKWSREQKTAARHFFKEARKNVPTASGSPEADFAKMLEQILKQISRT